jgi:hypothetical protein
MWVLMEVCLLIYRQIATLRYPTMMFLCVRFVVRVGIIYTHYVLLKFAHSIYLTCGKRCLPSSEVTEDAS